MNKRVDKRKCGRDLRGWRIPKDGTRSRQIYNLMREGLSPKEIGMRFSPKMEKNTLGVLIWKIRNPKDANEAIYRHQKQCGR